MPDEYHGYRHIDFDDEQVTAWAEERQQNIHAHGGGNEGTGMISRLEIDRRGCAAEYVYATHFGRVFVNRVGPDPGYDFDHGLYRFPSGERRRVTTDVKANTATIPWAYRQLSVFPRRPGRPIRCFLFASVWLNLEEHWGSVIGWEYAATVYNQPLTRLSGGYGNSDPAHRIDFENLREIEIIEDVHRRCEKPEGVEELL